MKNYNHTGSTTEKLVRPSLIQLRRELFAVANRNPRFRQGQSDFVKYTFEESERADAIALGRPSAKRSKKRRLLPLPLLSTDYVFEALRTRMPEANKERSGLLRPTTEFNVSLIQRIAGTSMPSYLAVQAYGLEAADAVLEAGPTIVEHQANIQFDTDGNRFHLCESVVHIDNDGDETNWVCSCEDGFHEPDDDDDAEKSRWGLAGDESEGQGMEEVNLDHLYCPQYEVPEGPAGALEDFRRVELMGKKSGFDREASQRMLALGVLKSINRVMDELAGA